MYAVLQANKLNKTAWPVYFHNCIQYHFSFFVHFCSTNICIKEATEPPVFSLKGKINPYTSEELELLRGNSNTNRRCTCAFVNEKKKKNGCQIWLTSDHFCACKRVQAKLAKVMQRCNSWTLLQQSHIWYLFKHVFATCWPHYISVCYN